jgi:hypothetical protein
MAESWSSPFLDAFSADKNIHVYEVPVHNDFFVWCLMPSTTNSIQIKINEGRYWMALDIFCNYRNIYDQALFVNSLTKIFLCNTSSNTLLKSSSFCVTGSENIKTL